MTARDWTLLEHTDAVPPEEFYCPTEDVWRGRWSKFVPTLRAEGMNDENITLVAAVAGEIGDNAFMHNVGAWRDVPGCWFAWSHDEANGAVHWIIADRGQGMRSSLIRVRPELNTDHDALRVALTEQVTGRAPEDRGRGLKVVVVRSLAILQGGSFELQSGTAAFACRIPCATDAVVQHMSDRAEHVYGTCCTMTYQYARESR